MKGEFRAQLPGKTEGDYYVVSIVYAGEGKFNGQEIVERLPRNVDTIEQWDCKMRITSWAMTYGLFEIKSADAYGSLEELAFNALGKGMHKYAWDCARDSRINMNSHNQEKDISGT
jgi:hypothetical protein